MRNLLFLLLLCSAALGAQEAKEKPSRIAPIPANFTRVMANEAPTSEEMDTLYDLTIQYLFHNQDTCLRLAQRGLELAQALFPGTKVEGEALMTLGDAYRVRSEWGKAKVVLLEGLTLYEDLEFKGAIASANLKLGAACTGMEDYEDALGYNLTALDIWTEQNDSVNLFKPYLEIAGVFALMQQPQKALVYNTKALRWGEAMEWPGLIRVALGNQSELEILIADQFKEMADTATSQQSIYQDSVRYFQDQALSSINRAISLLRNDRNKYRHTIAYTQLGDLQAERGNYPEAFTAITHAIQLAEEIQSGRLLLNGRLVLGKLQRLMGEPAKAVRTCQEALAMPEADKNASTQSMIWRQLYLAQKELGNYREALTHFEALTDFEQDNARSERTKAINMAEGKYQTAQQEKKILELGIKNAEIRQQRNYFLGCAILLTILGFLGFQLSKLNTDRNRKRDFANQLIDAQEEERKRIAQDLHDGIGQSLLVIKRQLEANKQSTLENRLLVASTLEEVRGISRDLHPVLLEKFGITTTIQDIIERIDHSNPDLLVSSEIANIDGQLAKKAEVQLFRTIQEALSNVVKHAQGSAAKVSVALAKAGVTAIIRDNGKGFDADAVAATSKSLGLHTMRERIESVGGTFSINPGAPRGTTISLWVPGKNR